MRRKKLLLYVVLSVLLCASLVTSVNAASMFSHLYSGPEGVRAYSLVETSDGGYAIAGGYTNSSLLKTDAFGSEEWRQTYGGAENDNASSLVATSDGGYAIAGTTDSFGAGNTDFWLVKTDGSGNMQWNTTYGGTNWEHAFSIVQTSDGGYALAGYTVDEHAQPGPYVWLVKTDATGNMEWNQTYSRGAAYSLVETADGGYAMAGGYKDFLLIKTDSLGNADWTQRYAEYSGSCSKSLVETSDGGYALAGYMPDSNLSQTDFWLVKTDATGNMEWNQTYGGTADEIAQSLIAMSDGGYLMAGETSSFGASGLDFWLVKTDAIGNIEWNQTYGGAENDSLTSLIATSDGGYAMVGTTGSFVAGVNLIWLVKTDEFGIYPEYTSWVVPTLVLTVSAFIIFKNKKRGKE